MKLAFPSIGYSDILISTLLREWGVDFLKPRGNTEEGVFKALLIAPKDACMPFKTVMGNMLDSYCRGADTGIFFGGCGPCAFGYFSSAMNRLFEENGINFRVLTLEFFSDDLKELLSYIENETGKSAASLFSVAPKAVASCVYLDRFENFMLDIRSTIKDESNRRDFNRYEKNCLEKLGECKSFFELNAKIYKSMLLAKSFEEKREKRLFVGIVGDIYSIIDSFSNYDIQRRLADSGVRTRRSLTLSKWLFGRIPFIFRPHTLAALKYMPKCIGGFARDTVGYTSLWSKNKDGIIQIYPLNCMPETAASAVLPKIHEKTGVPLLQLSVDEQTGEEGYITRVEAFVEMIKRKEENNLNGKRIFSRG